MYLWLAAQEAASQENGDTDLIPRKCDIITVTGQAEKCELARAALLVRNSSCLFRPVLDWFSFSLSYFSFLFAF